MRGGNPRRVLAAAAVMASASGAALLLWHEDPASSHAFPACPLHALTGLFCPGCGALRALHRLLHGQIWPAFQMNALVVVLAPLVLLGLVQHVFPRVLSSVASERAASRSVWALFAVIVLFAVMRNLPFEPFSWLAPR
jgi:hypothetical protein